MIKLLLISNVLVFLISIAVAGLNINLYWLGIISPDIGKLIDMNWVVHPDNVNPVSLFTSLFLHLGLVHLVLNLIMILYLGILPIKPFRFVMVYITSGMFGNIAAILFEEIAILGASGAILGVLGYGMVSIRDGQLLKEMLWITALTVIPGLFVSGISNGAHFGGVITGALLGLVFSDAN
jgi:membrane associated rhomboid family serine protease